MKKHFEKLICERCDAKCCRYVALEIDKPTSKHDYDQIRWYLRHKDVHVFIDHEKIWCLEFRAKCDCLGPDNKCMEYETRPEVCREHGKGRDCEFYGKDGEKPYLVCFDTAEDFEKYLEKRGINWRFKDKKKKKKKKK